MWIQTLKDVTNGGMGGLPVTVPGVKPGALAMPQP